MSEYYKEKKKEPSLDDKFKPFAHIVKKCEICKGAGYIFTHIKGEGEKKNLIARSVATECECVKRMYKHALYKEAQIPAKYWDLSIKDYYEKKENKGVANDIIKAGKNIKSLTQEGLGFLFIGGPGTGKTFLACEVLKTALKQGLTGYYEWFPTVVDVLSSKNFSMDEKKMNYDKKFDTVDVLILDELGKESQDNYGFKKNDISRILEINVIKKRSSKTTILISNLESVEEIKNQYGVYVDSVIRESFKVINLVGTDFRHSGAVSKFFGPEKEKTNE